ncbi:MAG TPA: hypothetical protein VNO26_07490 [Candidatus Limnocylindria bacterium]|nr:hypothetical protein [Candidatus Limnocylindria bacterium]
MTRRPLAVAWLLVRFPEVTYAPPAPDAEPVAVVCARMASAAIAVPVDPRAIAWPRPSIAWSSAIRPRRRAS